MKQALVIIPTLLLIFEAIFSYRLMIQSHIHGAFLITFISSSFAFLVFLLLNGYGEMDDDWDISGDVFASFKILILNCSVSSFIFVVLLFILFLVSRVIHYVSVIFAS